MSRRAFTVIELIAVIAIILTLAAVAISGTSRVLRSLQFTNAFNKIVFMVQQARSAAITGKDPTVHSYTVTFYNNPGPGQPKIRFFYVKDGTLDYDPDDELGDTYTSSASLPIEITMYKYDDLSNAFTECTDGQGNTIINFENGTGKTLLRCSGTFVSGVKIEMQDPASPDAAPKYFILNQASGIPQVF